MTTVVDEEEEEEEIKSIFFINKNFGNSDMWRYMRATPMGVVKNGVSNVILQP